MVIPGGITNAPCGGAAVAEDAPPDTLAFAFAVAPAVVAPGEADPPIGGGVAEEEREDAGDFSRADMMDSDGCDHRC